MLVPGGSVKIATRRSAGNRRRRFDVGAHETRPCAGSPTASASARCSSARRPFWRAPPLLPAPPVSSAANVVRALLAENWHVRALVRGRADSLDGLPLDRVAGDLFTPSLADAMRGCDAVFHLAAHYSLWHRDRADLETDQRPQARAVFWRPLARRAFRAWCTPVRSRRSACAATAARPTKPYQSPPAALVGAYKRSKYFAEAEARAAVAAGQDVRDREPDHAGRSVGCEAHADR